MHQEVFLSLFPYSKPSSDFGSRSIRVKLECWGPGGEEDFDLCTSRVCSVFGLPRSLIFCLRCLFLSPRVLLPPLLSSFAFNLPDLSTAPAALISAGHRAACMFVTPWLFAVISIFDHG